MLLIFHYLSTFWWIIRNLRVQTSAHLKQGFAETPFFQPVREGSLAADPSRKIDPTTML